MSGPPAGFSTPNFTELQFGKCEFPLWFSFLERVSMRILTVFPTKMLEIVLVQLPGALCLGFPLLSGLAGDLVRDVRV